MTLAEFTNPALIVPHLRGPDAAAVIHELSPRMQRDGRVPDLLQFYHAALNRELLVSTDIEPGIAFPHARFPGVKDLSFALGRSDEPISWGATAVRSVRLVFLLAVPATDATQYLALMSGVARLTKQPELVSALHSATDTFQILEILKRVPLRPGAVALRTKSQ